MLNVNRNHNPELMAACKTLRDYAEYTDRVRRYKDEYETLEEAVGRAIDECIEEGVLADFLRRHRAEVISVSIYEFIDDEKFLEMQRADAYEEGRAEGLAERVCGCFCTRFRYTGYIQHVAGRMFRKEPQKNTACAFLIF